MVKERLNVLISGASTGIGRHLSERLALAGYNVFAGVRSHYEPFEGDNVHPLSLDVCEAAQIAESVNTLKEAGGVDVLINNAGIAVAGPLECVGEERMRQQLEINVMGVYRLTTAFLPQLRESGQAKILNMSSVSGLFAAPFFGPYAASKFALEAMSDAWRRELRASGIDVVLIEPGPVKTPIWDKSTEAAEYLKESAAFPIYEKALEEVMNYVKSEADLAVPVDELGDLVLSVLLRKRPKARYTINGSGTLLNLLRLAPDRWVDSLLEKGVAKRR